MEQVYIPKQDYKVLVRCYTYNQSKYIEDALNGFAMQQTDFPFVCLVMDDCSTDGEQEVIKAWMECECDLNKMAYEDMEFSDTFIVSHRGNSNCIFAFYLLKQNQHRTGVKSKLVSPWRDHCVYEAVCEGDDYWIDPLKLQKQVKFLDANIDYSAIATQTKVIYEWNSDSHLFNDLSKEIDWTDGQLFGIRLFHTASMMHRIDNTLRSRPAVFSGDVFTMGLLSLIGKVRFIPDVTTVYRKQPSGASSTTKLESLQRDLAMIPYIKENFPNYNIAKLESYLNYTFAVFPIHEALSSRLKYALKSIGLSFSYFPKNLKFVAKVIVHLIARLRTK